VLIFDEVMTGFRVAFGGGAQEVYGIRPDLTTMGKNYWRRIAGGSLWADLRKSWILSRLWGRCIRRNFVRHPLAMAAGFATVKHLRGSQR